jgi:hypothetical protein
LAALILHVNISHKGIAMKKLISLVAGPVAAALLCVASVSPCYAATTAYVSGGGSDTNACTLTLPCRTIGHALGFAGGEGTVSCLDAGPYTEFFSTSSSFTLDCRGVVYASGDLFAFYVNANVVLFRNVIFDGANGGAGAVQITGGNVVFENCTFQNFQASPGIAVWFVPTAYTAHLTITDSLFKYNGDFAASGGGGIVIQPSGGVKATAVIERTQVENNAYGIVANGSSGTALVEVRYSTIASNSNYGIWAYTTGSVASIVVEHSASVQNSNSAIIATGANAFVSLNDSTVAWNGNGLYTMSGGSILSYKNNVIAGNLIPGVTPLSVSQQ